MAQAPYRARHAVVTGAIGPAFYSQRGPSVSIPACRSADFPRAPQRFARREFLQRRHGPSRHGRRSYTCGPGAFGFLRSLYTNASDDFIRTAATTRLPVGGAQRYQLPPPHDHGMQKPIAQSTRTCTRKSLFSRAFIARRLTCAQSSPTSATAIQYWPSRTCSDTDTQFVSPFG